MSTLQGFADYLGAKEGFLFFLASRHTPFDFANEVGKAIWLTIPCRNKPPVATRTAAAVRCRVLALKDLPSPDRRAPRYQFNTRNRVNR